MLTLEQIINRLADRNLAVVAREIGVTRAYLSAIRAGRASNPSYDMVKKLSDYLERGHDAR